MSTTTGAVEDQPTASQGAIDPAAAVGLAGHVGEHLAAIAALVGRACAISAPETREEAPDQRPRETGPESPLMASGPSSRSPSASTRPVADDGLMASGHPSRS